MFDEARSSGKGFYLFMNIFPYLFMNILVNNIRVYCLAELNYGYAQSGLNRNFFLKFSLMNLNKFIKGCAFISFFFNFQFLFLFGGEAS